VNGDRDSAKARFCDARCDQYGVTRRNSEDDQREPNRRMLCPSTQAAVDKPEQNARDHSSSCNRIPREAVETLPKLARENKQREIRKQSGSDSSDEAAEHAMSQG